MFSLQDVKDWKDRGKYFNFKGNNIFYISEGKGENLLIIHGYPYNSFEWSETFDALKEKFTVTIFDLLGMGFSDKPQEHRYSFEEYCEMTNALLLNLIIHQTHIISHDLGVSIVQELLARDLEAKNQFSILSSAFINGGLFMDAYKPRLIQRLLSQTPDFIGKFLSKKISKQSVNKSVRELFGKHTQPTDLFLEKQWEILNYNNGKAIAYLIGRLVFEKYRYQQRWIKAMQTTSIHLCYICGPADPNSGAHMAKRYEDLIPNSKIYMLNDNIGHWPFVEDLKGVLNVYEMFCDNYIK